MAVVDLSELRSPAPSSCKIKKVKYPNMKMLCEFDANLVPQDSVRIAGIRDYSLCDGPGVRRVVYFQGCYHKCKGCHNPETWAADGGKVVKIADLFNDIPSIVRGITFSGGEPTYQYDALLQALIMANELNLNTCIYTGSTLSEWRLFTYTNPELLRLCHYVKVGPYVEELRDLSLPYRGSSNQKFYEYLGGELYEVVPRWGLVHRKIYPSTCPATKVD